MKRTWTFRIIGIVCAMSLLLSGLAWAAPVMGGNDDQPVSKVSSLLALRIELKLRQAAGAGNVYQGESPSAAESVLSSADLSDPDSEKVFLHFAAEPTEAQISQLASRGITAYPDSWVPPVGDFPTGFVLADMPIDKLEAVTAADFIVNLTTAEQTCSPQNDVARAVMNVGQVWSGGNTGSGVKVAVLDSGIDTSNADFPTLNSSNSKDYSAYPALDNTIGNNKTGHGTHVAGSVLGRGVNSPAYSGMAPGADLVFLKIGRDSDGRATHSAMAAAIVAAADIYHADILTMSYGGWSDYHDGSNEVCQTVDYAVGRGTTVFMSAGNDAASARHYSGSVAANSSTDFIQINVSGAGDNNTALYHNLVWYDGLFTHNNLSLQYFDGAHNPLSLVYSFGQSESWRGTEGVYSYYDKYLPSGNSTYFLKVQNNSPHPQFFHIYDVFGSRAVTFASPDTGYTLGSPAEADRAIAVGAYVTRNQWVDYLGNPQSFLTQTIGAIATFSSRGPRVDAGAPGKPEIVAPGSRIISVRDNHVYPQPAYNTSADIYPYAGFIIDNDGLNGSGPADYLIMQGTSMACPVAAGVGALILSAHPDFTPEQVKLALESSAADKGVPGFDNVFGWGLINAGTAVTYIPRIQGVGGEIAVIDKLPLAAGWIAVIAIPLGLFIFGGLRKRKIWLSTKTASKNRR